MVVQIACDQHGQGAVRLGQAADRADRVEPGLLEQAHGGVVDEAEHLADLPVGGVDQPQGPVPEIAAASRRGASLAGIEDTWSLADARRARTTARDPRLNNSRWCAVYTQPDGCRRGSRWK